MDSSSAVTLLLLLGLALGRATATDTTTMAPPSDGIMEDLKADGFLPDHQPLITQAPHTQATPLETTATPESVPLERTVAGESEESAPVEVEQSPEVEGSAVGETFSGLLTTLTPSDADNSSSTTPAPEGEDRTTAEPREDKDTERTTTLEELLHNLREGRSGDNDDSTTESTAFTTVKTTSMFLGEEGSGSEAPADFETTTAQRVTEEPLTEDQYDGAVLARNNYTATPQIGKVFNAPQGTEMPKGHVTPDWVIIVGFLVGVAALVLLCVAIATRDRWNGRSQFNQTGVTLQPADQQRALEMQTFLQEQQPKENGKAEEYTVIPLDELPETYSS